MKSFAPAIAEVPGPPKRKSGVAGMRCRRDLGPDDFAAQAASHKAELAKDRERLVVPADPALAAQLAKRYSSKELGEITVLSRDGGVTFDFGEWSSVVASQKKK